MEGQGDQLKGRIKKAAGELTGNQKLKNEGNVDKASGKIKEVTGKVAGKIKQGSRKAA